MWENVLPDTGQFTVPTTQGQNRLEEPHQGLGGFKRGLGGVPGESGG